MNHKNAALFPPLGWNSWDCYGASVTEEEVRGNAKYMAEHLKEFGWEYIVVDIQWYEPQANSSVYRKFVPLKMDEYSRLIPSEERFPSSKNKKGFKPLSDYIHSLGLKFGIHIMRGIPRQAAHEASAIKGSSSTARDIAHPNSICPWNTDMYGLDTTNPASQSYYDSLFELYAEWGVDYVKVDDIAASRIYGCHKDEISLIHKAIEKSGKSIVLSLSPGPAAVEDAQFLKQNANLWRITDDFWDHWPALLNMFDRCDEWASYVGPGNWPDCDMLPLGHIGLRSVDGPGGNRKTNFTPAEQISMMTLWSIFRSPLMYGGELRDNDPWTLDLITNVEVLEAHRDGRFAHPLQHSKSQAVWMSKNDRGEIFLALFNLSDSEIDITVSWIDLELKGTKKVRNLWKKLDENLADDQIIRRVEPHGAVFLKIWS